MSLNLQLCVCFCVLFEEGSLYTSSEPKTLYAKTEKPYIGPKDLFNFSRRELDLFLAAAFKQI